MPSGINFFLSILKDFSWLGNWLFLFLSFIECFPFAGAVFPGGTLISIGGFFAAQGYFNVWEIILFSSIGAILGDYLGYSLGRWGRPWLKKKNLIKPELMEKSEKFFQKYGNRGLLWGRFVGITRAIIPFTAGVSHMKQSTFLFWDIISGIIWAIFNVGIGYFSGSIIAAIIQEWSHKFGLILLGLVILVLLYWIIRKQGKNLWLAFKEESNIFIERMLKEPWYLILYKRYPIISELTKTPRKKEKAFGFILIALVLIFLYILTLIL